MNCCTNNISLMILYSHFKLQAKAMKFHWQKEEQTRNSPGHKFWLLLIRFHKNPGFTNIMGISLIQNYFNSFRIIKCYKSKHPSLLARNPYIFNFPKSTTQENMLKQFEFSITKLTTKKFEPFIYSYIRIPKVV